jgi:general secretion pathway protein K
MKRDVLRARLLRAGLRGRRKRRGVALIMVLGALVILTAFVTELMQTTSASLSAALADRDSLRAEYNAKSGVNLARMLIGTEPMIRRAINPLMGGKLAQLPVWQFSDLVLGPFNGTEQAQSWVDQAGVDIASGKNLGLDGGHFELHIVDEDAKLNVNAATSGDPFARKRLATQILGLAGLPQYAEMFQYPDDQGQYSDVPTICGALIDWSDFDETLYGCDPFKDNASADGPEDNFYQSIGLNYSRKNAAFDSLEELRLVRGVSDQFWSTFVEPDANDPASRAMTVWGQGKINVNTANAQTILAVVCAGAPEAAVCVDPIQMQSFISAVSLAKSFMVGIPPFRSPKAFIRALQQGKRSSFGPILAALGIEPVTFPFPKDVEKAITTESKVFSIYADGVVPGRMRETRVRVHSVVDFRTATALGGTGSLNPLLPPLPGDVSGSSGAAKPGTPSPDASAETPTTPEELLKSLASDPLGSTVYFRME